MVHTARKGLDKEREDRCINGDSVDTTLVCYDLDISLRNKDFHQI